MYPVRSYANLDDRVSHEGESAYRVGREISKARAFSNFLSMERKKKKKKRNTCTRAYEFTNFSKGKSTIGIFFFFFSLIYTRVTSNGGARSNSKGVSIFTIACQKGVTSRRQIGFNALAFRIIEARFWSFYLSCARVHVSIGWIAGGLLFWASMEARKMEEKVHVVLARVY